MIWLGPAIAVWTALILVLIWRSGPAIRSALAAIAAGAGAVLTGLRRRFTAVFHDTEAMPRAEQRWLRLLAALGGYFAALFVIGLVSSAVGIGVVGTVLLMLFPGALIASRLYMAIKR